MKFTIILLPRDYSCHHTFWRLASFAPLEDTSIQKRIYWNNPYLLRFFLYLTFFLHLPEVFHLETCIHCSIIIWTKGNLLEYYWLEMIFFPSRILNICILWSIRWCEKGFTRIPLSPKIFRGSYFFLHPCKVFLHLAFWRLASYIS